MPPMGEVRIDIDAARRALARQSLRDYAKYVVIRSDDPLHPAPTAMVPYPYQVELGERWERRESMVVLKSRQIGASVWLRAYAAWRAWAHGWAVGYYSRGQAEAIAWLDGVEAILRELPASWGVRTRRRGELLEVGEGSVRAHPSTASAGIGYTYQLVIADEAAHHEYGAANYDNYAPTLSAGGQYIRHRRDPVRQRRERRVGEQPRVRPGPLRRDPGVVRARRWPLGLRSTTMSPVIQIRTDDVTRDRMARAARVRGMSQDRYLRALLDLHDAMRARADAGDDGISVELEALGLQTVSG